MDRKLSTVNRWSDYLFPILKGNKFNEAVILSTNIFAEELSKTSSNPSMFRIYACLDTKATLTIKRTQSEVTVSEKLNGGNDLSAGCCYMFDTLVNSDQTINFQVSADLTINSLIIVEIPMVQ
jgi:hypothetical protein